MSSPLKLFHYTVGSMVRKKKTTNANKIHLKKLIMSFIICGLVKKKNHIFVRQVLHIPHRGSRELLSSSPEWWGGGRETVAV